MPYYNLTWRNKWLTADARSIGDMITALQSAAAELQRMQKSGVYLEDDGSAQDDYARLVTTDSQVAEEFGFAEEESDMEEEDDL